MNADIGQSFRLQARLSRGAFSLDAGLDLDIDGVTGLFGPSGGGKSTLLRIIAGFERDAEAEIRFGTQVWQDSERRVFVPPHERPVGYVFQDARLFAHRSVVGNLAYAMNRADDDGPEIELHDVVTTFDLQTLLTRRVDSLSGGERQRVAIARTLLSRPRLLLLDEPLAGLDVGRKQEILPYLEALHSRFGVPTIYVSHSMDEVARLADRVVVLDAGSVRSVGGVFDVINRLSEEWPDSGYEPVSVFEAEIIGQDPEMNLTRLALGGQAIVVPMMEGRSTQETVVIYVRAADVALATSEPGALSFRNVLPGTVSNIHGDPDGAFAIVSVDIGGGILKAHLTRHAVDELGLEAGKRVYALLKTASFDRRR